jgi:hypothetical protein
MFQVIPTYGIMVTLKLSLHFLLSFMLHQHRRDHMVSSSFTGEGGHQVPHHALFQAPTAMRQKRFEVNNLYYITGSKKHHHKLSG